jgi:hypothetical protein
MTGELTKITERATRGIPGLGKVTKELQRTEKKIVKETKRPFKKPKIEPIQDPDPSPTSIMTEEMQAAKARVGKKKKGRRATILAGRMMARRRNILNTRLGE